MGIRELAEHLNLSIGTVSRALNDRDEVSPKTRRAVIEAAARLGYSPNQSGRSLRKGATGMVAALIPARSESPLAESIFMTVLDGLRASLAQHGLDLVILLSGREDHPFEHMRRIVERGIADGIVVTDTLRHDQRIDYLRERRLPFVTFGRSLSGTDDYPWLDLDFEGVARRAVARLAGKGHRRIALATTATELNYGYLFTDAYIQAMQYHGLAVGEQLILRDRMAAPRGYELGEQLLALAESPTAVILVDNAMAVGLYQRLGEAGLRPGTDLAVVGFIESPQCHFLSPALSYFRTPMHALGYRLGEALLAAMPGQSGVTTELVQEIWPVEFVAGDSDRPVIT